MTPWIIGGVLCVAAYGIGRGRPLHRASGWALGYLLVLTPERAGWLKMLTAAVLVPDHIARGHQAERRRPTSLRAAPQLSPEWRARAARSPGDAEEATDD